MRVSPISSYGYAYANRQRTQNTNHITNYNKTNVSLPSFGYKLACPHNFGATYPKVFDAFLHETSITGVYPEVSNIVTHLLYEARYFPGVVVSPLLSKVFELCELEDYDEEETNNVLTVSQIFDRIRALSANKSEPAEYSLMKKPNGAKLVSCYNAGDGKYSSLTFYPIKPSDTPRKASLTPYPAQQDTPDEYIRVSANRINGCDKKGNPFQGYDIQLEQFRKEAKDIYKFWPTGKKDYPFANLKERSYTTTPVNGKSVNNKVHFHEDGSEEKFINFINTVLGVFDTL